MSLLAHESPVRAYPAEVVSNGSGDINGAANFSCKMSKLKDRVVTTDDLVNVRNAPTQRNLSCRTADPSARLHLPAADVSPPADRVRQRVKPGPCGGGGRLCGFFGTHCFVIGSHSWSGPQLLELLNGVCALPFMSGR